MSNHENHLNSLLAIIHRDRGQHTENVGLEKSVADARDKHYDARTGLAASRKALDALIPIMPMEAYRGLTKLAADGIQSPDHDTYHAAHWINNLLRLLNPEYQP